MNHNQMLIFDTVSDTERDKMNEAFTKRNVIISTVGDYLKATLVVLRERGWKTHEPIWNAALFLNTICYDISIAVISIVNDRDDWKRRYWARSLALMLFEVGEDIPSVFGKRFREAAKSLGVPSDHLDRVSVELKALAAEWNENRSQLKQIRIIAGAHREHDALTLHETIVKIDLFELLGLGIRVGSILNDLGKAIQPIITTTSCVPPPELSRNS